MATTKKNAKKKELPLSIALDRADDVQHMETILEKQAVNAVIDHLITRQAKQIARAGKAWGYFEKRVKKEIYPEYDFEKHEMNMNHQTGRLEVRDRHK